MHTTVLVLVFLELFRAGFLSGPLLKFRFVFIPISDKLPDIPPNLDLNEIGAWQKEHALAYGKWIQKNCIVSRNGFRLLPSLKEEISNEKAYELYLESLKSK